VAARREQANEEQSRLMEAPLSTGRVANFKNSVLRGWVEGGDLRRLIQRYGAYEVNDDPTEGLPALSVHQFDPKDLYVEPSRFADSTWGADYGRALARGEDDAVLGRIASSVDSLAPEEVSPDAILGYLDRALAKSAAIHEPVILIAGSLSANWALAASDRFKYARHVPTDPVLGQPQLRPSGSFDHVPVYQFHTDRERLMLVADLRQLGTWRQYRPRPRSELSEYIDHVILFELETYSEESARQLLTNQPDAFRVDPANGRERSYDDQLAQIRTHVRVLVLEQFRYDVLRPEAGLVVRFTE
jgi:hypothetical protein